MNNIFCAEESRRLGEDLIGYALNFPCYILVEFPPPWAADALDSKLLPQELKELKAVIDEAEYPLRFLFIYNRNLYEHGRTRLIIFREAEDKFLGYKKQEFIFSDIRDTVPIIEKCIRNETIESEDTNNQTREILVCTHGSQDKCCAKYGNPFYRQAITTITDLSLSNVRVWQSSHFGGHRFAPTMIDFPEGRYYGRLDNKSFTSILTRTGDIECLKHVYRGWGILPSPVQFLERELILKYGWDWFDYQVQGNLLQQTEDESFSQVEIIFTKPNGVVAGYRANVIEDLSKSIMSIGDCNHDYQPNKYPQFLLTEIVSI
jgi:hypothetical protein